MGRKPYDIAKLDRGDVIFPVEEHPEERTARLAEEAAQAKHRRYWDSVLRYCFLGLILIVIVISCGEIGFGVQERDREWAKGAMMTVLGGGVSFLAGKFAGKKGD